MSVYGYSDGRLLAAASVRLVAEELIDVAALDAKAGKYRREIYFSVVRKKSHLLTYVQTQRIYVLNRNYCGTSF
jgi:hypothetical protein